MTAELSDRRARVLLLAGVLAGVALAAAGVVRSGAPPAPPADAVALVNGQPITRDALRQLEAEARAGRQGRPLDTEERRHLLERAVDEELLLERGLALGLARLEPSARRAIVNAVVTSIATEAATREPDEAELRSFFAAAPERFAPPGRLRLAVGFVAAGPGGHPEAEAWRRANELAARLRGGGSLAEASAGLGNPLPVPLPEGPLSLDRIAEALGPAAARAVEPLGPGEVAPPVRGAAGYLVLRLDERLAPHAPAFEEVRDRVRAAYLQGAGERAVARYVKRLRADAEVRVLDPELRAP